ncbi:hypothetical protein ABPG77_010851 [Micractinium sp. CCAP 211/92]
MWAGASLEAALALGVLLIGLAPAQGYNCSYTLTKQWPVGAYPASVEFSSSNNTVVVASYFSNSVTFYTEQGDFLSQFPNTLPEELAVDSAQDRIYVLGGGYLKAYTLSPPHQLVNSGPAPTARTVDVAADGSIWMGSSDPSSGAPSLTRLNATTGAVLQQFSITHLASRIAVSPVTGDLFYSSPISNTVTRLNATDGSVIREWGSQGSGNCQFLYPRVAVDSAGNVLVSECYRFLLLCLSEADSCTPAAHALVGLSAGTCMLRFRCMFW